MYGMSQSMLWSIYTCTCRRQEIVHVHVHCMHMSARQEGRAGGQGRREEVMHAQSNITHQYQCTHTCTHVHVHVP